MCTSPLYKVDFPSTMWKMKTNDPKKIDPRSQYKIVGRDYYNYMVEIGDPLLMSTTEICCGQCIECRIQKAQEWATRLYCESLMYPPGSCWFLTLTYAPEYAPTPIDTFNRIDYKRGMYSPLCKADVQTFMKNLRNKLGDGIRYFCCGEYMPNEDPLTSQFHMPHYHLCLFNLPEIDMTLLFKKKTSKGVNLYYNSDLINSCWSKKMIVQQDDGTQVKKKILRGWAPFSDFTATNAQYTAQYCVKKFTGKKNKDYYELCAKAQVSPLPEEFIIMSNRPGIGIPYLLANKDKLISENKIYMREGKIVPLPKFFKEKLFNDDQIEVLKLQNVLDAAFKKHLIDTMRTDKTDFDRRKDRELWLEKHSTRKRNMQ